MNRDRLLPDNPNAEKAVLGAALHHPEAFPQIAELLSARDFSLEKHKRIFHRMADLFEQGQIVNTVTLGNELQKHRQLQSVGGLYYLTELPPLVLSAIHHTCELVKTTAIRRRGIEAATCLIDDLYNGQTTEQALASAERVSEILSVTARRKQQHIHNVIDQIPNIFSFPSKGIEWVVERLIARGSVTMLAGESGHGKSTLTAAIADAVTKGRDFCGRKCAQLRVLILDRENGIDAVQERFNRLGIHQENCSIIVWGGWCEIEPPDPSDAVVLAWVKKTEPKPLVIVDSVAGHMQGDENNATDVRKFMDKLRQLAHLGAAVVTLHNSGKAETSLEYRGSSDFKGSIDIGINVRNFGDGELGKIRLKAFKTRFAIDGEVILNYHAGRFNSDDRPLSASRLATEQLTALLRNNPGIKKADFEKLAASLQLGRDRARAFLDVGVRADEIRIVPAEKGAKLHYLIEQPEVEE